MKRTRKSLLSVLLTLVMLVGLVPALATEAHAANPWPAGLSLSVPGTQAYTADAGDAESDFQVTYDSDNQTVTVTLRDYYLYGQSGIVLAGETSYNLRIMLVGENWITSGTAPAVDNRTGGDIIFDSSAEWTELGLETRGNAVSVTGGGKVYIGTGLYAGTAPNDIYDAYNAVYGHTANGAEALPGDYGLTTSTDYANKLKNHYAYFVVSTGGILAEDSLEEDELVDNIANDPTGHTNNELPEDLTAFNFTNYKDYTITERTGLNKISFNVGMKNADSYTGPRKSADYRYFITDLNVDSTGLSVTFANNTTEHSLTFAENANGTTEMKSVMLNIEQDGTASPGVYVYRITQRYTGEQHSAGFNVENNDEVQENGYWFTDYYLFFNVNGNGKITQAILLPDGNQESSKLDGFYNEYVSSVQLRTVTLAKESQSITAGTEFIFDVEFELPAGINSAKIEIEGFGTVDAFDAHRKATAESVKVKVGQTIEMRGIPEGTIVRVKENDNSGRYVATSVVTGMANSNNLTSGEELANGYTTYGTVNGTGGKIVYTNEYREISLTGVTLRYAPYMAMMGAGLAVVGLSKTRRKEEEI